MLPRRPHEQQYQQCLRPPRRPVADGVVSCRCPSACGWLSCWGSETHSSALERRRRLATRPAHRLVLEPPPSSCRGQIVCCRSPLRVWSGAVAPPVAAATSLLATKACQACGVLPRWPHEQQYHQCLRPPRRPVADAAPSARPCAAVAACKRGGSRATPCVAQRVQTRGVRRWGQAALGRQRRVHTCCKRPS